MNKKIIIILTALVVLICWYFFAPIRWTFGLRQPRNYNECLEVGGKNEVVLFPGQAGIDSKVCSYKGLKYLPNSTIELIN